LNGDLKMFVGATPAAAPTMPNPGEAGMPGMGMPGGMPGGENTDME